MNNDAAYDPQDSLIAFFSMYPPAEAKSVLWNWLSIAAAGNAEAMDQSRLAQFALFFDALNDLIEAAYMISENNKSLAGEDHNDTI